MNTIEKNLSPSTRKLIIAASVAIPLVVAVLFGVKIEGYNLSFLPPIYATINGLTALFLIAAVIAVKQKKIELHKRLIQVSISLSLLFLLGYVAYHITSESTPYGGEGSLRYIYFFILISHILLSIGIIPLVLFSYAYGINYLVEKHKRIVKFAFPLWLYVAITGVIVYLMISPYYA
ncbi:MAG: DUF420 domain-containing protein [Luteibaculum sp.]